MKKDAPCAQSVPAKRSLLKAFLLCLPMMLLTFMMLTRGNIPTDGERLFSLAATFLFFNLLFFLMVRTGKTDRFRSILFVTLSVCFVISFISHLIEVRGSMALSRADMIEGLAPFCHLVIPMTLIPAALTKTIIFPGTIVGTYTSIAAMFVLWIGVSLALGRGLCSWFCFFGGLEDGFSRILRKPIIKNINKKWTYLPYAVLLVVVLMSAVTLSPTFCLWLCPFKTVTEFVEITSVKILIQTIIFVSLFIGLVIVLPILTKRRTQCGLFCPFGAFQSVTNKTNAFEVRIDREKCVKCSKCIQVCPTFSIDEESLGRGITRTSCTKCGKCVDACPKKALFYHVKGTPLISSLDRYRLLFLYPAFLVLAFMAGRFVQDAIIRTIKLIATGSMI
jgi:NAD-dependent dihydropyrimidine dehydrogenase PreA subunit